MAHVLRLVALSAELFGVALVLAFFVSLLVALGGKSPYGDKPVYTPEELRAMETYNETHRDK